MHTAHSEMSGGAETLSCKPQVCITAKGSQCIGCANVQGSVFGC